MYLILNVFNIERSLYIILNVGYLILNVAYLILNVFNIERI